MDSDTVGCGALILSKESKRCLFLLRNVKQAGTWGLPGGKVEQGETPVAGLLREIREETGRDLTECKIIPIETFTSENSQFVYHTYMILVDEEFLPELNEEHRGFCWVRAEDYPKPLHSGVFRTFKITAVLDKLKTIEEYIDNKKGA